MKIRLKAGVTFEDVKTKGDGLRRGRVGIVWVTKGGRRKGPTPTSPQRKGEGI